MRLSVFNGLLPSRILTDWSRITEVDGVYCALRTESLHKKGKFRLQRVKHRTRQNIRIKKNMSQHDEEKREASRFLGQSFMKSKK